MKTVLLGCTLAAFALSITGAPAYTTSEEEQGLRPYPEEYQYLREARSHYSPQYITPCAAAAAAASAGSIQPYGHRYHLNVPSFSHYGYGAQQYRTADTHMAEPEMLAFSDMGQLPSRQALMLDHIPMARNAYGAPVSPISSLGSGLALNGPALTSAAGAAYGIFPNSNVGGCNVPLLFSCSPSISSGHLVDPQSHYSSGPVIPIAANAYRLVEEQPKHNIHEHSEEEFDQHVEPVHEASHEVQSHS